MKTTLLSLSLLSGAALAATPALNIDLQQTTVSGLSSGGYMATQFHIAHSDWVQGAGVIAAGPYFCAQNSLMTALERCVNKAEKPIPLDAISAQLKTWEAEGKVAPLNNLKNDKVWLLHGTADEKIITPVNDKLAEQYRALAGTDNVTYNDKQAFAHHFPTKGYGTDCKTSAAPYLGNCEYDAAGELLKNIAQAKPANGAATGKVVSIEQPKASGMAETGYAYVPEQCLEGQQCTLHISFHGCNQFVGAEGVELDYVENTGLNPVADANNMVVLYPQTQSSTLMPFNPQGCWDWWGYSDENYATREGQQIKAVTAMAKALAGE